MTGSTGPAAAGVSGVGNAFRAVRRRVVQTLLADLEPGRPHQPHPPTRPHPPTSNGLHA